MNNWIILLLVVTNLAVCSAHYDDTNGYINSEGDVVVRRDGDKQAPDGDKQTPLDFSDVPLNFEPSPKSQLTKKIIYPHVNVILTKHMTETPLVFLNSDGSDDSNFQGHKSIPLHKDSWAETIKPRYPSYNLNQLQFAFSIEPKSSHNPFTIAESSHPGIFKTFFCSQNLMCVSTAYTVYMIEKELLTDSLTERSDKFQAFSRRLHHLPRVIGAYLRKQPAPVASDKNVFIISYQKPCWNGGLLTCGSKSLLFIKHQNPEIYASVDEFILSATTSYSAAINSFVLNKYRFIVDLKKKVVKTGTIILANVRWESIGSTKTTLAGYLFKQVKVIPVTAKIDSPFVFNNELRQNAAVTFVHLRGITIMTYSMDFQSIREGMSFASYSTVFPNHLSLFTQRLPFSQKQAVGDVLILDRLHDMSLFVKIVIRHSEYRLHDEEGRRMVLDTSPIIFSHLPICMKNMDGSKFVDESDQHLIVKRSIPIRQWCRPVCKIAYKNPDDIDVYDDLWPVTFKTFMDTVDSTHRLKWTSVGGGSFVIMQHMSKTVAVPFKLLGAPARTAVEEANALAAALWRVTPQTTMFVTQGHRLLFVVKNIPKIRWDTISGMERWKELIFKDVIRIPVYNNIESPVVLKNNLKRTIVTISVHFHRINIRSYVKRTEKIYIHFASQSTIHSSGIFSVVQIQPITFKHGVGDALLVDSVKISLLAATYSGIPQYQLATERQQMRDIQVFTTIFSCLPICVKNIDYPEHRAMSELSLVKRSLPSQRPSCRPICSIAYAYGTDLDSSCDDVNWSKCGYDKRPPNIHNDWPLHYKTSLRSVIFKPLLTKASVNRWNIMTMQSIKIDPRKRLDIPTGTMVVLASRNTHLVSLSLQTLHFENNLQKVRPNDYKLRTIIYPPKSLKDIHCIPVVTKEMLNRSFATLKYRYVGYLKGVALHLKRSKRMNVVITFNQHTRSVLKHISDTKDSHSMTLLSSSLINGRTFSEALETLTYEAIKTSVAIPHRVCYQNNECLSRIVKPRTGAERENSIRACESKKLMKEHRCTIFASFVMTPKLELRWQLEARGILYKLKLVSLLRLNSVVKTAYSVETIIRENPKTTIIVEQSHWLVHMVNLKRYQATGILHPITSNLDVLLKTSSGIKIPIKKFVAPSTVSSPRLRFILARRHILLQTGAFHSHQSFENKAVGTSALEEAHYKPAIRTFLPVISDNSRYVKIAMIIHVRSNANLFDYSYAGENIDQSTSMIENKVDEDLDIGKVTRLVLFTIDLYINEEYRHYTTRGSVTVIPLTIELEDHNQNFGLSLLGQSFYCPKPLIGRLLKRSFDRHNILCIHGTEGPYYWIMPFKNFFIVWGIPGETIEFHPVNVFNNHFQTTRQPKYEQRLFKREIPLGYNLYYSYPNLDSNYYEYPSTFWFYSNHISVKLVMLQLPPIVYTLESVTEHLMNYIAYAEPTPYTLSDLNERKIPDGDISYGRYYALEPMPLPSMIVIMAKRPRFKQSHVVALEASARLYFSSIFMALYASVPSIEKNQLVLPNIKTSVQITIGHSKESNGLRIKVTPAFQAVDGFIRSYIARKRTERKGLLTPKYTSSERMTYRFLIDTDLRNSYYIVVANIVSVKILPKIGFSQASFVKWFIKPFPTTVAERNPPYLYQFGSSYTPKIPYRNQIKTGKSLVFKSRIQLSFEYSFLPIIATWRSESPKLLIFPKEDVYLMPVWRNLIFKSVLFSLSETIGYIEADVLHSIPSVKHKVTSPPNYYVFVVHYNSKHKKSLRTYEITELPTERSVFLIGYHTYTLLAVDNRIGYHFKALTFQYGEMIASKKHMLSIAVFKDDASVKESFKAYIDILLLYSYQTENGPVLTQFHVHTRIKSLKSISRLYHLEMVKRLLRHQFNVSKKHHMIVSTGYYQRIMRVVTSDDDILGNVITSKSSRIDVLRFCSKNIDIVQVSWTQLEVYSSYEPKHTKGKLGKTTDISLVYSDHAITSRSSRLLFGAAILPRQLSKTRKIVLSKDILLVISDSKRAKYFTKGFKHGVSATQGLNTDFLNIHVVFWMLTTQYNVVNGHELYCTAKRQISAGMMSGRIISDHSQYSNLQVSTGLIEKDTTMVTEAIAFVRIVYPIGKHVITTKMHRKIYYAFQLWNSALNTNFLVVTTDVQLQSYFRTDPRHIFIAVIERLKGAIIYPGYTRKSGTLVSLLHRFKFSKLSPSYRKSSYPSLEFSAIEFTDIDGRRMKRYLLSTVQLYSTITSQTSVQQHIWDSFHASASIEDGHIVLMSLTTFRVFTQQDTGMLQLIANRYLIGYVVEKAYTGRIFSHHDSVAVYSVRHFYDRSLHQSLVYRYVLEIRNQYLTCMYKFGTQIMDITSVTETDNGHSLQKLHNHFSNAVALDGSKYFITKNRQLSFRPTKSETAFKPSHLVHTKLQFIAIPKQLKKSWEISIFSLSSKFGLTVKSKLATMKQSEEINLKSSYEVITIHTIELISKRKVIDISKHSLSGGWDVAMQLISSQLPLKYTLNLTHSKGWVIPIWSELIKHNVQYIKPTRCEFVAILMSLHENSVAFLIPEVLYTVTTYTTITDKHQYQLQHSITYNGAAVLHSIRTIKVLPQITPQMEKGTDENDIERYSFSHFPSVLLQEYIKSEGTLALKFLFGKVIRVSYHKVKFVYTVDRGKTLSFFQTSDIEHGVILLLEQSLRVNQRNAIHKSKRWFWGQSIIDYTVESEQVSSVRLIPKTALGEMFHIKQISKMHPKIITRNVIGITVVVKMLNRKNRITKGTVKDINTDFSVIPATEIRHIAQAQRNIETLLGSNDYYKTPIDRKISVALIILNMTPFAKFYKDANTAIQIKEHIELQTRIKVRFLSSNVFVDSSTTSRANILQKKLAALRSRSDVTNGRVMALLIQSEPLHDASLIVGEKQSEDKNTRIQAYIKQLMLPKLAKHHNRQDFPKFIRSVVHEIDSVVKYVLSSEIKGKILLCRHHFNRLVFPEVIGSSEIVTEVAIHLTRYFKHHHSAITSATKLMDERMSKYFKLINVIQAKLKDAEVDIELFAFEKNVKVTSIKTVKYRSAGFWKQQFVQTINMALRLKHIKLRVKTVVTPKHIFYKWPFIVIEAARMADGIEVATLKNREITGKNIVIDKTEVKSIDTRSSRTAYIDGDLKYKIRKIDKYGFSLASKEIFVENIVKESKQKRIYITKISMSTEKRRVLKSFLYINKEKAKTSGMMTVNRFNHIIKRAWKLFKSRELSVGTLSTAPINFVSPSLSSNHIERDPVRCTSEIEVVDKNLITTWTHSMSTFTRLIPSSVISGSSGSSKGPYSVIYSYQRYEMDRNARVIVVKDGIFGAKKLSIAYISYSSPILVRQSANLNGPNIPGGFKYNQLATQRPSRVKGLKSTLASTYLNFIVIQCRFYKISILRKESAFDSQTIKGFDVDKDLTCNSDPSHGIAADGEKISADLGTKIDGPSNPIHQKVQLQGISQMVFVTTCKEPLLIRQSSANSYVSEIVMNRPKGINFTVTPNSLHQMVAPKSNQPLPNGHCNSDVFKMTSFSTARSFKTTQEGIVTNIQNDNNDNVIIYDPINYQPHGLLLIGISIRTE